VLVTNDNQLYLEPAYIFGCLRDGAKYTPRRRGTLQPILASTLQVLDERVLVDRWLPATGGGSLPLIETEPVYLDVRSVRNPSTGARNVRYRVAVSPGWNVSFMVSWDNTLVSENELGAIVRDAGQFVGLGDGRSIGFGRFTVNAFQVEDSGASKKAAKGDLGKDASPDLATRRKKVRALPRNRTT
jgi:hypothetical protein